MAVARNFWNLALAWQFHLLNTSNTQKRELHMTGPTEQEIRTRAYELWKDAGEPPGTMDQLWYQAERELLEKAANGKAGGMNGHHKPAIYQ
ncbi:MAG: hypothetical protein V7632_3350 [Bradyrhizobium sp.]|jgi:hypothetical protein